MAGVVGVLLNVVGAILIYNGATAGPSSGLGSVIHQIYSAIYIVGGVLTVASGFVVSGLVTVREALEKR